MFPSPCGELSRQRMRPISSGKGLSGSSLMFPSPCGELSRQHFIPELKQLSLYEAFPSPCGELSRQLTYPVPPQWAAYIGVSIPLRGIEQATFMEILVVLGVVGVSIPLRGIEQATHGDFQGCLSYTQRRFHPLAGN